MKDSNKITVRGSYLPLSIASSLVCFASVLSFAKSEEIRPLALNLICLSGGAALTSVAIGKAAESEANTQADEAIKVISDEYSKTKKELSSLAKKYASQTENLTQAYHERNQLKALTDSKESEKQSIIRALTAKLEQTQNALSEELNRKSVDTNLIQQTMDKVKLDFIQDLQKRIFQVYNSLSDKVEANLSNPDHENIHLPLQNFSDRLAIHYEQHCEALQDIHLLSGDCQLIMESAISAYSKINDEISALKVKYRNILNIDTRRCLDEAYTTLEEVKDSSVPKQKAVNSLREQEEFDRNEVRQIRDRIDENDNSLEEMRGQVFDLIGQIDQKNLEIDELRQQIKTLNQPITWKLATGSNELTKANLVIRYFADKGLRLDRAFTTGDIYESKVYFHTDNNPRTIVFKELNDHSESLQQLCLTQKPVVFDWDAEKGLMVALFVWKEKPKEKSDELSDEAVSRLARSWETWKKHAKKWNRIRITGGSGAGKSPLTERIVSEQLQLKKIKGLDAIKLYNPQAGSRKDNWSFPNSGSTHRDSIKGIADLTKLCSAKYQGDFRVWIFDEVDSTIRQAPPKQRPTADDPEPEPTMSSNMLSIITQIDHTSQAVFYLGQGANTGKIPNTIKGDWNNLVAIHINGNAQDYLRLAEHIDKDTQAKLVGQAELLQKYCSRKNDQLGLERTDPGAYRYALIDEYGEKQYYVLLPLFSADEFLESLSTNTQPTIFVNSDEVVTVDNLEPVLTPVLTCPNKECGSTHIGSKGEHYHKCLECGKTWKRK